MQDDVDQASKKNRYLEENIQNQSISKIHCLPEYWNLKS